MYSEMLLWNISSYILEMRHKLTFLNTTPFSY